MARVDFFLFRSFFSCYLLLWNLQVHSPPFFFSSSSSVGTEDIGKPYDLSSLFALRSGSFETLYSLKKKYPILPWLLTGSSAVSSLFFCCFAFYSRSLVAFVVFHVWFFKSYCRFLIYFLGEGKGMEGWVIGVHG